MGRGGGTMKKKLAIVMLATTLLLTGCTHNQRIEVINGSTVFSTTHIDIDDEYRFKDFSKEYTDDGQCIVTIVYEEE